MWASQLSPATAVPTCSSIWNIFHMNDRSCSLDPALSSAARTTPSGEAIPRTVAPRLTVSLAYSTWKSLPSGENTVMARSYAPGTANIDKFYTWIDFGEANSWVRTKTFPTIRFSDYQNAGSARRREYHPVERSCWDWRPHSPRELSRTM